MPYQPDRDPQEEAYKTDSFSMRARGAALRAANPNLGEGDAHVLAQKQYTENENARVKMFGGSTAPTSEQYEAARTAPATPAAGLYPRAGGIDVNSYTGSMWNGTAQPKPSSGIIPGLYANTAADKLLRARFGAPPNERPNVTMPSAEAVGTAFNSGAPLPQPTVSGVGQIDIADANGTRSVAAPFAGSPGGLYSAPASNPAPAQPSGLYSAVQPAAAAPFTPPAYKPGTVDSLMQNIGHDPSTNRALGLYKIGQETQAHATNEAEKMARTDSVSAENDRNKRNTDAAAVGVKAHLAGQDGERAFLAAGGDPTRIPEAFRRQRPEDQSPLAKMISDHNRAIAQGRTNDAEFLKRAIQNEVTPKGMSLTVGPDGAVQLVQGPNNLTTGTTTESQKGQFDAERIVKEGAQLLTRLRPQDLGAAGMVKEEFVNKALAQLDPSLADATVSANRTALRTWRESTLRHVSSDTRFSNADRAAVSKLLPEDGVFESLPSAQAKMLAVMTIMKGRAGMQAARRGEKSVVDLPPDELVNAAKAGKIPREVAAALLHTLHPDYVDQNKSKPSAP